MASFMFEQLQEAVWAANMRLVEAGLVILTWGNASGVDRERGIVAIKPSGVAYDVLQPYDIVLVSLATGEPLPDQPLHPSSDTPTHVCLYQQFPAIGGIVHTHSRQATAWAQACRPIPCYGTTHADAFHGPVPVCRPLSEEEVQGDYEWATGRAIVESAPDPAHVPAMLVPYHGPFTWGMTPDEAVEHAIVLEEVATLATLTETLHPQHPGAPEALVEKHFLRKHGAGAYYGQVDNNG